MRAYLIALGAACLLAGALSTGSAQAAGFSSAAVGRAEAGVPAAEIKNGPKHGKGKHLGWSRGKHKGWYKERGYERRWGHHPGRGGPVRAYGGPPGHAFR